MKNETLQKIADKYREQFVCGRPDAFEIALKMAYKLGSCQKNKTDASIESSLMDNDDIYKWSKENDDALYNFNKR
jgi:hypothetical protein